MSLINFMNKAMLWEQKIEIICLSPSVEPKFPKNVRTFSALFTAYLSCMMESVNIYCSNISQSMVHT